MVVKWKGQDVTERVRAATMRGIIRGTELVKETAINKIMHPPKSGRVYVRGGVAHQASAPGQPPASDTGQLVSSARTDYDHSALRGTVNFTAPYADGLEIGTEKMEARPYVRPSLAERFKDIQNAVEDEINKELAK